MTQAIKYQSTTINPRKSAMQLGEIIEKYGARQFSLHWNEQQRLVGVSFMLVDHQLGGVVPVRLKSRTETIRQILKRAYPSWDSERLDLQADRIAWRHIKDLSEQMLLAAKVDLFSVAELFMSGVVIETEIGTETVGEYFARRQPELGAGEGLRLLEPGKAS